MEISLFGVKLASPVVIGSGPLSYGSEGLIRMKKEGAGAVVTKTLNDRAAVNDLPHIALEDRGTLINCEKWSDYTWQRWMDRELPQAKEEGVAYIVSTGVTLAEDADYLDRLNRCGALAAELVSYNNQDLPDMVRQVRRKVDLPLIVKLSPNSSDFLDIAEKCQQEGADAFTGFDSMGPAMKIDLESGLPCMGDETGQGWISGRAILPFTIDKIFRLRKITDLPIIGLGGASDWQDGAQILMAGASLTGICSGAMLHKSGYIRDFVKKLDDWMTGQGYDSYEEVSGLTLRKMRQRILQRQAEQGQAEQVQVSGADLGKTEKSRPGFAFDKRLCVRCGLCQAACPYQARSFDQEGNTLADQEACRRCGLCASVCRTGALKLAYSDR